MTAGAILLRSVQDQLPADPDGAVRGGFEILWGSLMLGVIAAAAVGWSLSRSIEERWRRGVVGAVGAMAGVMVGVISAPIDALGGRSALVLFFFLLSILGWLSGRRALEAAKPNE